MMHTPYDPLWESRGEPHFTKEWTAKHLRYRHPRHWHWLRIYIALFWLCLPILIVWVAWR